jgi:hypothetical protein
MLDSEIRFPPLGNGTFFAECEEIHSRRESVDPVNAGKNVARGIRKLSQRQRAPTA